MTPTGTPRTDAAENAQEEAAEYIAHLVPSDFARQLERELTETAKDYHSLAELLDGHDATECRANLVKLKSDLDAEREQVAILRSDEKRLVGFAKTYRARADDLDDTLAAERALADRLAAPLMFNEGEVESDHQPTFTPAHVAALAAWKEARHDS